MGKYNAELIKAGVLLDGAGQAHSQRCASETFRDFDPAVDAYDLLTRETTSHSRSA
jgi:hypothetical protein